MRFIDCTDLVESIQFQCNYPNDILMKKVTTSPIPFDCMFRTWLNSYDSINNIIKQVDVKFNAFKEDSMTYTNIEDLYAWANVLNNDEYCDIIVVPQCIRPFVKGRYITDFDLIHTLYPDHNIIISRDNYSLVYQDEHIYIVLGGLNMIAQELESALKEQSETREQSETTEPELTFDELRLVVYHALQATESDTDTNVDTNTDTNVDTETDTNAQLVNRVREYLTSHDSVYDTIHHRLFQNIDLRSDKQFVLYGWIAKDSYMLNNYNTIVFDSESSHVKDKLWIERVELPIQSNSWIFNEQTVSKILLLSMDIENLIKVLVTLCDSTNIPRARENASTKHLLELLTRYINTINE